MKIFFLWLSIFFFAAAPVHADGPGKVKVVATLFPQFDFARQVGRDKAEVSLLLPPGVESHTYEPKPRDAVRINNAGLFLYTGKYMEPWVDGMLKGVADKRLIIVDTSRNVALYDKGGVDPHIWLDLDNARVMVDNIAGGFIEKDPGNKKFYLDNAEEYKDKLKELDAKFKDTFAGCKHDTFIYGGHFAFGYFVRRYHLKYLSAYKGFSPDSEPTPNAIMELIRKMKAEGLKYVYYEEMLSPRLARTIAGEAGAGLLPLNSAHNVTKRDLDSGVTFMSIMEDNIENLKKGLECR